MSNYLLFSGKFEDCHKIYSAMGSKFKAGNYELHVNGRLVVARCGNGGWTVIQSRGQYGNPTDYFYKGWDDYVNGFGVPGMN